MFDIFHRYLEMLLCFTAVAVLTASQIDGARTRKAREQFNLRAL